MPFRHDEIAEQLYILMPHAVSIETLAEYGLEVSSDQAQDITRETLSLSLYWIASALRAHLSPKETARIFHALRTRIDTAWEGDLGLGGHERESYWREMEARRQVYDEIIRNGGAPPSLYLEAAGVLESGQTIHAEDRQKLLALFIDLIPEEQIGELAAEIEPADVAEER
mgnify:CR=1 FL=1